MPLWTCDFVRCRKPAVRTLGNCELCSRHLCSIHLEPEFHHCPGWEVSRLIYLALSIYLAIHLTWHYHLGRHLQSRSPGRRDA